MEFSKELKDSVIAGDVSVSFRLWRRPKVKVGGRYPVGPAMLEVDSIELVPFASITGADVRRSGEVSLEALRGRAAHAGPIDDDTLLYRIEFHVLPAGGRPPAPPRLRHSIFSATSKPRAIFPKLKSLASRRAWPCAVLAGGPARPFW